MVSTSNTDGKEEFQRKKTPGPFKGVRMRKWGRWVSEIRVPKSQSRIWLGSYDAPEKAARAYDAALYCLRGIRGEFNFPAEKRPELPNGPPTTLSKMDIKAIAERFAKSISVSVPMSSPATPPPPPPPPPTTTTMTMTTSPDVPVSTTETEMMGNYNIFDVALDPGNLVPPLDDSLWLWDDQIIIEPEFSLDLFKGF